MGTPPRVYNLAEIERALPDLDTVIASQAAAFIAYSSGRADVAPVQHLDFGNPGDYCVKSGFLKGGASFVVKVAGGGFHNNAAKGLPTYDGCMLVFSQTTGLLEGLLLDKGYLTDLRTAAACALAARVLAPADLECIGVVGTGIQCRWQLRLLRAATRCRRVLICGRSAAKLDAAKRDVERGWPEDGGGAGGGFRVETTRDVADVCRRCRLIVTTTSAKAPVLTAAHAAMLRPGTHITAMGSDGIGKQELDAAVLARAAVVVADSREQCCSFGEVSHALAAGALARAAVRELGELVSGAGGANGDAAAARGREGISIFDSTGVAVQDVAVAELAFNTLERRGGGGSGAGAASRL